MIVEAVRDDGAMLVTDGAAAAVVMDDRVWYTTRASILSKGVAWIPVKDQRVPVKLAARVSDGLAEINRMAEL